ncbi:MAG TPA: helix-turn-helix transcriptional regulator [Candidatus Acidoferrum sp.]|nr:helix-turn-helix transcriptional regulator [Candidatus Acidoferrum sp.]
MDSRKTPVEPGSFTSQAGSSPPAQLARSTEREHEVLVLVAVGKTNRQIGDRLRLSARTVQKHLEHVYEKLGVRTRTEAAMKLQGR